MLGFLHSLKNVVRNCADQITIYPHKEQISLVLLLVANPKKMWSWKCLGIYVTLIRLGMHLFFATKIMVWK